MLMRARMWCVFVFVFPLHAQIKDIYTITELLHYLDPAVAPERTLIIFDLDNTVIASEVEAGDMLDSPQWLSAMIRQKMEISHLTKMRALEFTLPLHFLLAPYSRFVPVEQSTVSLICLLQEAGYRIIALTARSPQYLQLYTRQGLCNIGIDFSKACIGTGNYVLHERFQYAHGIIFVAGGHKGDRLLQVLETVDYMPDYIIAVDDKDYCLYELEGTLKQYGIRHTCLWYHFCDESVHTYDIKQSQATFEVLCARDPLLHDAYQIWLQEEVHEKHAYSQTYTLAHGAATSRL